MDSSNTKIFRRGIPTDADCKALNEHFPPSTLTTGRRITYAECESVIRANSRGSRFKSVTHRWRMMLEREHGIILKVIPGECFLVADNADKCLLSCQKSREAEKKARRSMQIAAHVDRAALPDDMQRAFDANTVFAAAIIGLRQVKKQAELPVI